MDVGFAKSIIKIIRQEQEQRESLLSNLHPEVADDQWLFTDALFIAELCLMLLVAVRHQVERELILLATRAADDGNEIEPDHYRKRLRELEGGAARWDWSVIESRLKLKSCNGQKQMEALRLLANSYKHDPSKEPSTALLDWLKLDTSVRYAPLPESGDLQEGLAVFVGLGADASYCDIAETFAEIAQHFLADVQAKAKLSRVKWGPVSLSPKDAAH